MSKGSLSNKYIIGKEINMNFWIKMVVGEGVYDQQVEKSFVVVHTKSNAPDPIRTPKLSDFRHG